nr:DUF5134 domain-containing protein [Pseudonocardia acidicola]
MSAVLTAVCAILGALHVVRLVVLRTDVVGEGSHAAMAFGMAAMFSPLGDPVPAPVRTAVFVLCAAWFAAPALRSGFSTLDAGHHVIGTGAMLFMLFTGAHQHAAGTGGGHMGHGAHAGRRGRWGRVGQATAAAHLVMAGAMAVVLLGMV